MNVNEKIVKNRVKLLRSSPFFGTLLLNSRYEVTDSVPTAATDGDVMMLNEEFMSKLDDSEFRFVLLHEVLHMALDHVDRLKDLFERDPGITNIAADIVVNGIIKDNGISVPNRVITNNDLKHLSAREIYSILKRKQQENPNYLKDEYGENGESVNQCLMPGDKNSERGEKGKGAQETKTNWKDILNKAMIIAKSKKAGAFGAGLKRVFNELIEPTINWRDVLYRYVTASRSDFEGFDRRMVHRNLYLDDLAGEKIRVALFLDTSGSVDMELLSEFISELKFAITSLPNISGEMWYFDTKLYTQGDITELDELDIRGGGGTSFAPVMKKLKLIQDDNPIDQVLGIIFTDGHASMYDWDDPECNLLWCISPGGVEDKTIPLGEVVRVMK